MRRITASSSGSNDGSNSVSAMFPFSAVPGFYACRVTFSQNLKKVGQRFLRSERSVISWAI